METPEKPTISILARQFWQRYSLYLIFIIVALVAFGAVWCVFKHYTNAVDANRQAKIVTQQQLQDINALQNVLSIREKEAVELRKALAEAQTKAPSQTFYVTAPTVEKAAVVVQEQIKHEYPSLPPAALEKTDRTVVTPNVEKQKVDVYKIDFDRKWEIVGLYGKGVKGVQVGYNPNHTSTIKLQQLNDEGVKKTVIGYGVRF